jgi:hypothetical protein
MPRLIFALIAGLAASAVLAQEAAVADKTPAAEQAADKAVTTGGEKTEEFKPPPGFATKKRGEVVVYCMRDSTVGTRFKTEKCYSRDQLQDYLLAQEENKRNIDRIRNTCGGGTACATN